MLFDVFVVGYVRQNPLRAAVTVLTLAIGTAVALSIVLINSVTIGNLRSDDQTLDNRVNLEVVGRVDGVNERLFRQLQADAEITEAYPRTEDTMTIMSSHGGTSELTLIGVDTLAELPREAEFRSTMPGPFERSGSSPTPHELMYDNDIIISAQLANEMGRHIGDSVSGISGTKREIFTIGGIMPATFTGFDPDVAFVDIGTAQEHFDKVGRLDRIDCVVPSILLASVARRLNRTLPSASRVTSPGSAQDVHFIVSSFQSDLAILAYVALAVSACLAFSSVSISVIQRRSEVGTVRALGTLRRNVFLVFVCEGAGYGSLGCFIGVLVGALLGNSVANRLTPDAEHLWYSFSSLAEAFVIGVIVTTVSSLIPALTASRIPPALAMRSAGLEAFPTNRLIHLGIVGLAVAIVSLYATVSSSQANTVERCLGIAIWILAFTLCIPILLSVLTRLAEVLARKLPLGFRLGAETLSWAPSRTTLAIATLTVAVGLSAGLATATETFKLAVQNWADRSYQADEYVTASGSSDPATNRLTKSAVEHLDSIRGVSAVSAERTTRISISSTFVSLVGRYDIGNARSDVAEPRTGSADLSHAALERLHLKIGGSIPIRIDGAQRIFIIEHTFADNSSDPERIVISHKDYRQLMHDDTFDSIAIYEAEKRPLSIRKSIRDRLFPLSVEIQGNRTLRVQAVEFFNNIFFVEQILGAMVIANALFGVTSTLFALVLERRKEINVMRRLGVTIGQLRTAIIVESSLIGVISCLLGLLVGITLAISLIWGVDRNVYGADVSLHVPSFTLLTTSVLVIFCAALAGIYPAKLAARLTTSTRTAEE